MSAKPMSVRTIALALLTVLSLGGTAQAYQPVSQPWSAFEKQAELVIWGKLVKWEVTSPGIHQYTFAVNRTYRGPKLDKVVLTTEQTRYDSFGPVDIAGEGFLFLKKKDGAWVRAARHGSWWPHASVRKPDLTSFVQVKVGELLHDLPEPLASLKKPVKVVQYLLDNREHTYEVRLYVRDEVSAFLDEATR